MTRQVVASLTFDPAYGVGNAAFVAPVALGGYVLSGDTANRRMKRKAIVVGQGLIRYCVVGMPSREAALHMYGRHIEAGVVGRTYVGNVLIYTIMVSIGPYHTTKELGLMFRTYVWRLSSRPRIGGPLTEGVSPSVEGERAPTEQILNRSCATYEEAMEAHARTVGLVFMEHAQAGEVVPKVYDDSLRLRREWRRWHDMDGWTGMGTEDSKIPDHALESEDAAILIALHNTRPGLFAMNAVQEARRVLRGVVGVAEENAPAPRRRMVLV